MFTLIRALAHPFSFILSSVISIFDIPKLIQKLYSIDYGSIGELLFLI